MQKYPQQLLGDLIVVQPEQERLGRIVLPDWQRSLKGVVLAVGPGKPRSDGSVQPMELKGGEFVAFSATSGMEAVYDGKPIRIMREDDVMCVIEERASTSELVAKLLEARS